MVPTNDPKLKSWVEIPDGSDFPIQNLPFGIFKTRYLSPVAGVAIGEQVLDLVYLHEHGFLDGLGLPPGIFNQSYLNNFFELGRKKVGEVRSRISELLRHDCADLRDNRPAREIAMLSMNEITMQLRYISQTTLIFTAAKSMLPMLVPCSGIKKCVASQSKHLPVGYNGRASSIVISGNPIQRPKGQVKTSDAEPPSFCPTRKLDFELEVAFITSSNSKLGTSIPLREAEDHIMGIVLFNDWSARDIQRWEYVPLGPLLGKSFGSTMSPWVVTLDALEPFRAEGPEQNPHVLPYLSFEGKRNFDIQLVLIAADKSEATTVCRTNFKYMYWNMAQQLAHLTVNGCNIQVGDLYASGTISGPSPGSYGSMLELTWNGQRPLRMPDGTERKFLEDGDTVIIRGHAEKDGLRIGFGDCKGMIRPAR